MATSPLPLNFLSLNSPKPSSNPLYLLNFHHGFHSQSSSRTARLSTIACSSQTIEKVGFYKKKRKPKPSFLDKIQEKWSVKNTSLRKKLPWQEQMNAQTEEIVEGELQFSGAEQLVSESYVNSSLSESVVVELNPFKRGTLPPWVQKKPTKPQFDSEIKNFNKNESSAAIAGIQDSKEILERIDFDDENGINDVRNDRTPGGLSQKTQSLVVVNNNVVADFDDENGINDVRNDRIPCGPKKIQSLVVVNNNVVAEFKPRVKEMPREFSNVSSSSVKLPWEEEEREVERENVEVKKLKKVHTDLAEKVVPEPELKRLRNMAQRMVERIKVGSAGVTQPLVDSILKKWKMDEVVKLKFEGPPSKNMRRTHEILESRTGGLVIWRSGSSIVLYRGMGYKLDCIQSYNNQSRDNVEKSESPKDSVVHVSRSTNTDCSGTADDLSSTGSSKYSNNLSGEELKDLQELNLVLDELGPRYESWSGREPLPVDADLLRGRVPGYKTPLRRLPYGIRQSLRDKEMTYLRQTAKQVPPHFALGRNRELQGLATAMIKLWETSAIAKIAIKRGVQNTSNERMAEELKILTGGTLLSRNKEYIVFYRGNDFLPRGISQALQEKEKISDLRQDEEEKARQKAVALIDSNVKLTKQPLVAGTLAETKAATTRWSNQLSNEELETVKKDLAVARHASLVKFLENKLAIAKGKITLAEKALLKMQENLQSSDLPSDLETLTNEERFLFRKIGLSMKTYLPLGRREVFDGTIENMHLHWKYKELVKVIVDGKNLPQVKHIAISLEAESGGVLVSVDKTIKGYAIIVYRGKNYQRPSTFRPKNLLTKRQALARAIELQRREALKHHVFELQEKIENLKSELEHMELVEEIDEETLHSRIDGASDDDDNDAFEEDESDETNLDMSDFEDEDDEHS